MEKYAAFTAIGTFPVLNPVTHTQTNSAIEYQLGKTQVQSDF